MQRRHAVRHARRARGWVRLHQSVDGTPTHSFPRGDVQRQRVIVPRRRRLPRARADGEESLHHVRAWRVLGREL